MSNPCHIELILTEAEEVVQKAPDALTKAKTSHLNSRQRAQRTGKFLKLTPAQA